MVYFRSISALVFLYRLFDLLIPRIICVDVAFMLVESDGPSEYDEYVPLCDLADVTEEDDEVAMVGKMRSFNLFGFALFPKLVGELEPYDPYEKLES